ncbi:MAG: phosphotransferase [Chloroflexota bacterium]|nr:phosphotransferase [Chloroflexota bacterium]
MTLSTLWKVDSTVDKEGRSPIAEQILTSWEHDGGSAKFFRSSANFVYMFRRGSKVHFLRFADSSERQKAVIEAEVELLLWLSERNINVAKPVLSRNGRFMETTATGLGTFHAVVFVGLEGDRHDIDDLDVGGFQAWGSALGGLHSVMKHYKGAGLSVRHGWRDQLEIAKSYITADDTTVRHELGEIESALGKLPATAENFGLIHADFELDNLCWRSSNVGMLDFDNCQHNWYAADIAFALRDLFSTGADLSDRRFQEFTCGYTSRYPLEARMLRLIPLFLRMARMIEYATLVRCTDLPAEGEYPPWLENLNMKLKNRMAEYKTRLANRMQEMDPPL